jgi:hypothetical protein
MHGTKFVWLTYSVLMTAINAWVVYTDLNKTLERANDEGSLKQFLLLLADDFSAKNSKITYLVSKWKEM